MLILSSFINNIVNTLIRNHSYETRVTISVVLICVALVSLYLAIKRQPKDKPGLKVMWTILFILSTIFSVLYLVL